MAKTKISEFSATPGNNTDIDGINIAEGCAPSGINDAIRELMAQLKDFQAGTAGDSFNGPVGTTTAAAGAFTTLTTSGAVTHNGGTANGVAYLNGSKVLTTGSALTFDGTTLIVPAGSAGVPSVATTGDTNTGVFFPAADTVALATGGSERVRIASAGNLLVGTTSGGEHILRRSPSDGSAAIKLQNGNASGGTYVATVQITEHSPNNTSSYFISCVDSTAERATIRANGGLANYSANNVNLSDQRLKTDVQLADNYLDKICAIPVKTFLYKDQTDTERNLGVMAQDVDAVAPELIDHNGFGETPEGESPYLSVYQTDLQYALMKCIQELKAELDSVKAELATLKGN